MTTNSNILCTKALLLSWEQQLDTGVDAAQVAQQIRAALRASETGGHQPWSAADHSPGA